MKTALPNCNIQIPIQLLKNDLPFEIDLKSASYMLFNQAFAFDLDHADYAVQRGAIEIAFGSIMTELETLGIQCEPRPFIHAPRKNLPGEYDYSLSWTNLWS